jgi:drug/metabolite transporter (DMT)-like permease
MIGIAIGHVFYFIAIRSLGIAISSGVIQLQPIIVSVASLWIFGERLSPAQWAFGGVALVGAMVILSVQQRLRRAARAHSPPPAGATTAPGEPVNNERAVTR